MSQRACTLAVMNHVDELIERQARELHDAWTLGGLPLNEREAWRASGRRPSVPFEYLDEGDRERWMFAASRHLIATLPTSEGDEAAAVLLLLRRGYIVSGPGVDRKRPVADHPRQTPAHPPGITRDDWIAAFVAALTRLRPHLAPQLGSSKLLAAVAAQQWAAHRDDEPAATAEAYHRRTKA